MISLFDATYSSPLPVKNVSPLRLCLVNPGKLPVLLISAAVVLNHRSEHLGKVDMQTHLSPGTRLTQTAQFTYQVKQKM